MEEDKLPPLKRGCDVGIQMCEARDLILKFVESRMEFIAPNVCQIVGPGIAAKGKNTGKSIGYSNLSISDIPCGRTDGSYKDAFL